MLKEGMFLLGTALLLHSRNKAEAEESEEGSEQPDSEPGTPGTIFKLPGDPVLDSAITENPLLFGHGNAHGPGFQITPFPGLGGSFPSIGNGQPLGSGQSIGITTAAQLSAANKIYQQIIGSIPSAIAQKVRNVKALADFQARSVKKVVSIHKRVLKKIF